ncbi:hypothetical protein [Desulfosarcina variabilis]
MKRVTRNDVNKLVSAPLCYALLMENDQLEEIISVFVSVLNKKNRGDQNS